MDYSMDELWKIARQYGLVNLFTSSNGAYSCAIKFHTIEHTELEAKSGYGNQTPHEALLKAINSAQNIVSSISNLQQKEFVRLN